MVAEAGKPGSSAVTAPDLRRLTGDRVAVAILLVGAIVRALFLAEVLTEGISLEQRVNIDAYLYHRHAVRIVAGDPLSRDRYEFSGTTPDEPGHPRQSFGIAILGADRYDREYGPHTFFDYPGYPYFVAASYAVFGIRPAPVLIFQEALDLLGCALIYLIGIRVFDRTVARLGLLLALISP